VSAEESGRRHASVRRDHAGFEEPAVMNEIVLVTLEHMKKNPETVGLRALVAQASCVPPSGDWVFQGLLLDVTMHDMMHRILREC
jgi:hypothetical protein